MRLEGLGQLKKPVTSAGIEPATFRLVAQWLNQLLHRVTPFKLKLVQNSLNARALRGCNKASLPVIWGANKKSWVTQDLFEGCFKS
jgi:hypothetical protein